MSSLLFFSAAVQAGTPLLFATIGEIMTEKSGNLNLGVEGLMLIGAVAGFAAGMATQSAVLAILFAAIAGAGAGAIYAFFNCDIKSQSSCDWTVPDYFWNRGVRLCRQIPYGSSSSRNNEGCIC